jgi:hypothetical protein
MSNEERLTRRAPRSPCYHRTVRTFLFFETEFTLSSCCVFSEVGCLVLYSKYVLFGKSIIVELTSLLYLFGFSKSSTPLHTLRRLFDTQSPGPMLQVWQGIKGPTVGVLSLRPSPANGSAKLSANVSAHLSAEVSTKIRRPWLYNDHNNSEPLMFCPIN